MHLHPEESLQNLHNLQSLHFPEELQMQETRRSETQFTSFTRQCAQQLESIMPDNANIGVMSGKTISAVAKQFPSARKKHLHFIPLVGAMGNSGNDWNANSIARILGI